MSDAETRTILEAVASGTLSPEDAAEQLEAAEGRTQIDWVVEPRDRQLAEAIAITVHSGDGIEIEGDASVDEIEVDGPARVMKNEQGRSPSFTVHTSDDTLIRVNPHADLAIELHGPDAVVRGLKGTLRANCHVGDLVIEAELRHGDSALMANAGDVTIRLAPLSDVRVMVRAPTDVRADEGFRKTGRGEWTLGNGAATLTVDGNIGDVILAST
jgi:hypothetical protein